MNSNWFMGFNAGSMGISWICIYIYHGIWIWINFNVIVMYWYLVTGKRVWEPTIPSTVWPWESPISRLLFQATTHVGVYVALWEKKTSYRINYESGTYDYQGSHSHLLNGLILQVPIVKGFIHYVLSIKTRKKWYLHIQCFLSGTKPAIVGCKHPTNKKNTWLWENPYV